MRKFLRHRTVNLRHEINVTPFVDVMLVLLIIFMVAAPMMNTGISLDLPRHTASTSSIKPPSPQNTISLDKEGRIALGPSIVALDHLVEALKQASINPDQPIYLRADRGLAYEQVIQVMTTLVASGFTRITFLTEKTNASS